MHKTTIIATVWVLALALPAFARGGGGGLGGVRSIAGGAGNGVGGSGRQMQLGDSYAIFNTVSIFDLNRNVTPPPPPPPPPPLQPDKYNLGAPVFRGSIVDDVGPLAMLEIQEANGAISYQYLREGQLVSWNHATVLRITLDTLRLSDTSGTGIDIPIGSNLYRVPVGTLPTAPSFVSNDVIGASTVPQPGAGVGGLRGLRGGFTPGTGARGNTASGLATTLINPALNPPLPPGTTDDLAARMALRRQIQLRGTASSMPAPLP